MPRLFTGIEIPHHITERLGLIGAPLTGARWIKPENMHITLRFAGDIDERTADEWAEQLALIEADPFDVTIAGLGAWGGDRPRLIWAGIEAGDVLEALQRSHEFAARAVGLAPVSRNFKPHVTLARLRGARSEAVAGFLGTRGDLRCETFTVSRVVLFGARPGLGGGPYVVEDSYPLGGSFGMAGTA